MIDVDLTVEEEPGAEVQQPMDPDDGRGGINLQTNEDRIIKENDERGQATGKLKGYYTAESLKSSTYHKHINAETYQLLSVKLLTEMPTETKDDPNIYDYYYVGPRGSDLIKVETKSGSYFTIASPKTYFNAFCKVAIDVMLKQSQGRGVKGLLIFTPRARAPQVLKETTLDASTDDALNQW